MAEKRPNHGEIGIHYPLRAQSLFAAGIDRASRICVARDGPIWASQVWTNDNLEYRSVLASSAAIVARFRKLGTAVTVPYFRNPADLAMAFGRFRADPGDFSRSRPRIAIDLDASS
jgi:hypothetical protein